MKCANCSEPALYVYDAKPLRPTPYCATHLPTFLRQAAKAGLLPVTDAYNDARREAFAILAPVQEAAPVEEAAPEAPKKRRRTKKAAPVEEAPVETPTEEPDVEEPTEGE